MKRRVEQKKEVADDSSVQNTEHGPRLVPADLLDKQALELDIKNEAIEMLGQKVAHLQNLLQLKDQRIDELNKKLDECISNNQPSTNTNSFFKIF